MPQSSCASHVNIRHTLLLLLLALSACQGATPLRAVRQQRRRDRIARLALEGVAEGLRWSDNPLSSISAIRPARLTRRFRRGALPAARLPRLAGRDAASQAVAATQLAAGLAAGVAAAARDTSKNTRAQEEVISDTLGVYARDPDTPTAAAAQALLTALAQQLQAETQAATNLASQRPIGTTSSSTSNSAQVRRVRFISQPGYIDFSVAPLVTSSSNSSTGDSTTASCEPSCSYTNPSAAYGLAVLPLGPQEDLQSKVSNPATPRHVAQNLDGRYGPRLAPSWQLQRDEVVLLAGCTPPEEASRYFGLTGYLHTTYLPDAQQWLEVFGSLGDSLSVSRTAEPTNTAAASALRTPASSETGAATGGLAVIGRLQTSKPLSGAAEASTGAAAAQVGAPTAPAATAQGLQQLCNVAPGGDAATSTAPAPQHAFASLTVVLMGNNPSTVQAAADLVQQAVAAACCDTASADSTNPSPSTTNNSSSTDSSGSSSSSGSGTAAVADRCHRLQVPFINVLPIPGPAFGERMGLDPSSNYFSLIVRNIAPAGPTGAVAFRNYTQQPHLMAWRLTPTAAADPAASSKSSTPTPAANNDLQQAAAGNAMPAATAAAAVTAALAAVAPLAGAAQQQGSGGPTYPAAAVISRQTLMQNSVSKSSPPAARAVQYVSTATNLLVDELHELLRQQHCGAYDCAWGQGSVAPLAVLGVDWGLDCLEQQLDWCNADNRDATYLSTLPFSVLAQPGQLLLVAGPNYVKAGLATFMNVAITDPLQQQGLLAFDDTELQQAGPAAAAALKSTLQQPSSSPVAAVAAAAAAALQQQLTGPAAVSERPNEPDAARQLDSVLSTGAGAATESVASGSKALGAELQQALQQGLLYVIAVSRNCSGVTLSCKELPTGGPGGVPLSRPLMTLARVYVNPATGVGPDPAALAPFNTLLLTPEAAAGATAGPLLGNRSIAAVLAAGRSHDSRLAWPRLAQLAPLSAGVAAADSSLPGVLAAQQLRRPAPLALAPSTNRPLRFGQHLSQLPADLAQLAAEQGPPVCPANTSNTTDAAATGPQMQAQQSQPVSKDVSQNNSPANDPCVRSLVGLSQCTPSGVPDVCCGYVGAWNASGCWCSSSGQQLLDSMPTGVTPVLLQLLGWVCA